MNHKDIENRSISNKEIQVSIKSLPRKKSPGLEGFSVSFPRHLKNNLAILLKLFNEVENEGRVPNTFYETSIALTLKPDKKKNATMFREEMLGL